ncbi:MAG: prepilin-type N-terminal cleavage/methylation domain-containing protein [Ilumatobacteraceae bacterium]|nr:prepilin-type N-terminal cleavage/methylation domain-containing protein [Ilumatobacteraceae bacterium]
MAKRMEQEHAAPDVRDRGVSLVEVVVAIVLIGTVVVATINAVSGSIRVSSTSRTAAQLETAIVNAADRVNRAERGCDYTIYAQAAVQTEGWDPSTAAVTHEYYLPAASPTQQGTWQTGSAGAPGCAGTEPTDLLVQRVTINITSPDGSVRRSIQVVKSSV